MAVYIKSTYEGSDGNAETRKFIAILNDSLDLLNTLGNIQACAGGMSMESRSRSTFETHASLENYINQLVHARRKELDPRT